MFRLRVPAWLTLWLLAPVLGELFSGSSPPKEFFKPGAFLMLGVLYGGGALLAREYTLLWRKDWRSLLLLGMAYAIAEEGLMCKSFFNPHWQDVGKLGEYGRWAGVNWIWTYYLTLYHTFYSIGASVVLAEILHHRQREQLWLKPWARRLFLVLFLLDIWVGFRFFPYHPSLLSIGIAGGLIALLTWLAKSLPARSEGVAVGGRASDGWKFGVWGFLVVVLFFVWMFIGPHTPIPAGWYLLLSVGATVLIGWLLWRMSGGGRLWTDRHRAALLFGILLGFALLDVHLALNPKASNEDMSGMGVVAVVAVALGVITMVVARRASEEAQAKCSTPCP
ncbi:MAG: hypothetical protein HPY54_09205 [Chthonomonadetes bacterium]|nr:hypothetical protein [Chthonomonadetes bacterium]